MTAILKCDQAIFTSIRGPMGEGYRIVAASRGLRPEEKQVITRCSPSHDALCWSPEEEPAPGSWYGAAFFPLPTGRLCVAYSRFAGLEHTARGGQRVYTHNVVFDEQHLPLCGFNAFNLLRAMVAAGLHEPQLKPPNVLPELTLCVESQCTDGRDGGAAAAIESPVRRGALRLMFGEKMFALPRSGDWAGCVEALLLGLPGPLRCKTSFSAGLRFAMSRNHKVQVFRDEGAAVRAKVQGQTGVYLTADSVGEECVQSSWAQFVESHWARRAIDQLDRRTSRPFADVTPAACERIGQLYNLIDSMPAMKPLELLSTVVSYAGRTTRDVEEQIRGELVGQGQKELCARATRVTVQEFAELWPVLCREAKGPVAAAIVEPVIAAALRGVARSDPLRAVEALCEALAAIPKTADGLLDELMPPLCNRATGLAAQEGDRMTRLRSRLTALRPNHASVRRFCMVLDSVSSAASAK